MKKNWQRRLIVSYIPAFYVIVLSLILIFFHVASDYAQRQAVKANRVFVEQVIQVVDQSLRSIDMLMINEIQTNAEIRRFMENKDGTDTHIIKHKASVELEKLKISGSLIDSIYLYRIKDSIVLSNNVFSSLEQFADKDFILKALSGGILNRWTESRSFSQFTAIDNPQRVVSLVRKVPVMEGTYGIMVANVSIDRLESLVSSMSDPQISFVYITDNGSNAFIKVKAENVRELSTVKSEYTGWQFHSGVSNAAVLDVFTILTNVWIIFGIVLILAGGIWMVIASHQNYKPIESILTRINALPANQNLAYPEKGSDEFKYIHWTLDGLLEQSGKYEMLYKEDIEVKKRHLFRELLVGAQKISEEEWKKQSASLGLAESFDSFVVIATRIDGYSAIKEKHPEEELKGFKSVLAQSFCKFAELSCINLCLQWDTNDQMTLLLQWCNDNSITQKGLIGICENIRLWVNKNLPFTVTIGMGSCVVNVADIPQSYLEALESLEYRTSMGKNSVIVYWEVQSKPGENIFKHLSHVNQMAQTFKSGDPNWRNIYEELFMSIKGSNFKDTDITGLIRYLVYCFNSEMHTLGDEFKAEWEKKALYRFYMLMEGCYSLDELQHTIYSILTEISEAMVALRQSRSSYAIMEEVKKYIDNHFMDPNISRERLGEVFSIHVNYLSKLFKDEIGYKFVDYLLKVRVEHAKKLLKETGESIEQIGSIIGYSSSISFIRAFKKYTGVTPGDYRKDTQV